MEVRMEVHTERSTRNIIRRNIVTAMGGAAVQVIVIRSGYLAVIRGFLFPASFISLMTVFLSSTSWSLGCISNGG
jgi:hypothetical protein